MGLGSSWFIRGRVQKRVEKHGERTGNKILTMDRVGKKKYKPKSTLKKKSGTGPIMQE